MITALYPKGTDRLVAAASYAVILLYINTNHQADARTLMFRLLDFTTQRFNAGKLIGGYLLSTRQQLLAFETGMYCTVGLSSAGLVLPGDPSNVGVVTKVVFPSTATQNVVTPNGDAGVQLPPNSFTGPAVLVTIVPLPGTGPSGPLNTKLDQYGPFSDVKVTPETALNANVAVGLCLDDGVQIPTVFLAHNVLNNQGAPSIEVLPPGPTISGLCGITTGSISGRKVLDLASNGDVRSATRMLGSALVDMLLPTNANATGGGITGTTKKFSPFGGVDTKVYMTALSPTSQTSPAGAPVASPPSVRVLTLSGDSLPNVNALFAVQTGGGTVGGNSTATVATNLHGVATVSDWVINTGSNTLLTTGTFADPTVLFAPSTVTGFPQSVTVDPVAGITFSATGGDFVPYGSSYLFLVGPHDVAPGFQASNFATTGWSSGSGPFGTGDLGGTVCAINSESGFTLNHAWTADTDLLLRKSFSLPAGWTTPLTISAAIDNDIAVYVNGHAVTQNWKFSGDDAPNYSFNSETGFVTHENCATKGSLSFSVPSELLVTGQNVVAIRARDRGSVNYVDAKVSVQVPQ